MAATTTQVKRLLQGWGLAQLFIWSGRRRAAVRAYDQPGTVLAITAHFPNRQTVEAVLGWIVRHGFTFISTDEMLAIREGRTVWRPRIAWLTFDDGWREVKSEALPILEKYQIPATIFVAPHETERGQVWTNSVSSVLPYAEIRKLYSLSLIDREKVTDEILFKIGNPRRLLAQSELIELAQNPLVTLENHTFSHMSCSHRPVEEMVNEVRMSGAILRDWTGREPRLMCFPFGHCHDEHVRAVRNLGLWPVTCDTGVMNLSTPGGVRNMFREGFSNAENICRAVNAWRKVVVPDK